MSDRHEAGRTLQDFWRMIRKSVQRFSLATNAKRLRGDHAPTRIQSAMTIHPDLIAL
jgi:hypothetical protein